MGSASRPTGRGGPIPGCHPPLVLLITLFSAAFLPLVLSSSSSIHTVVMTECTPYFTWQSLGMLYSHRQSGQPGPMTRIMCCTEDEFKAMPEGDLQLMPTHVAPSYTKHPRTGDIYSAYNKPVGIIDWLAKNDIKEEYVLVIDADMIMRTSFTAEDVGAHRGLAVSAFFGYMKGVSNELAMKHVPEVLPRNDTLAGPVGRRGDMVGGFTLMHTEDLRRVGPLWLKYTEDVRFDPDAWTLSGDAYSTNKGDKPWISEMYGYSFGCAKADVWHKCHHTAMLYPAYEVSEVPKVLHYGLLWTVAGTDYTFDKHWHYNFDALSCPPWQIGSNPRESKKGLFAHPPHPSTFKTTGFALLRDLLAIEVPVTLNEAFCDRFERVCPPSDELTRECGKAHQLAQDLQAAYDAMDLPDPCRDTDKRCPMWAKGGECTKNQGFMLDSCMLSCKVCQPRKKRAKSGGAPDLSHKEGTENEALGLKEATTDEAAAGEQGKAQVDQAQAQPKKKKASFNAGSHLIRGSRHGGGGGGQQKAAPQQVGQQKVDSESLRRKCTKQTKWSMEQVKECLRLAEEGQVYDPPPLQRATHAGVGEKTGGEGDAASEAQGQQAEGEAGGSQEGTDEGEGADVGSQVLDRGDVGRALGEREAAAATRAQLAAGKVRQGGSRGLIAGLLVWAVALLALVVLWLRRGSQGLPRFGGGGRTHNKAKYAE